MRILISSNWSLREQKLGDGEAAKKKGGGHKSQFLTE